MPAIRYYTADDHARDCGHTAIRVDAAARTAARMARITNLSSMQVAILLCVGSFDIDDAGIAGVVDLTNRAVRVHLQALHLDGWLLRDAGQASGYTLTPRAVRLIGNILDQP